MAENKQVPAEVEVIDEKNTLELQNALPNGTTTLVFDFDGLNGYTLLACEKQAKKQDPTIAVPALSMVYQAHVAAAAAKVKYDDILGLKGQDFNTACMMAQHFLLGSAQ